MQKIVEIKWLKNLVGLDAIKAKRNELLKEYHPDKNINSQYDTVINTINTQQINNEWEYIVEKKITDTRVKQTQYSYANEVTDDGVQFSQPTDWANPFNDFFTSSPQSQFSKD